MTEFAEANFLISHPIEQYFPLTEELEPSP